MVPVASSAKNFIAEPPLPRPSLPYDPAGIHIVEFTDSSILHGTLTELANEEMVLKRSDASSLLKFPIKSVTKMTFDTEVEADAPQPKTTVQFTTGDWMVSDVLMIRDGKAELRLANQQRVTVDRDWLSWVCFSRNQAPDVFHGPDSMDGWTSNGAWSCENQVLRCKQMGNIGRNFSIVPDRLDLQFEMEKSEVQKNFMLSFNFARRPEKNDSADAPTSAWSQVRLNEGQLYVYAASGNENKNSSRTLPRLALKPNDEGKFHYRLLFDRVGGKISIYINGKLVADQETPAMAPGDWSGDLKFQPMRWGSDADWSISKVDMVPWDGNLPQADGSTTPARLDSLTLQTGEIKTGRLESLLGAVVRFRSAAGVEDIPRDSVSMLRLHKPAGALEMPVATGPTAVLTDRGELHLQRIALAEGSFVLGTAFAGDLALPQKSVTSLSFPHKVEEDLPVADKLVFRNGDQLRGALLTAAHDAPVRWKSAGGVELEFQTKRVGGVLLAPRKAVPLEPGDSVVRFRNGDWLGGMLLGMDDKAVHLKSAFGNEFSIERAKVQTLYLSEPAKAAIWEGATDPDSWWKGHQGKSTNWVSNGSGGVSQTGARGKIYLDGAYLLPAQTGVNGGIGKIIEGLPERLEVSFDAATASNGVAFNLQLFYEKQANNGLMIQIWQGGMYIYDLSPRSKKGMAAAGQPLQIQWGDKIDNSAKRHRFQIFADRRSRKITVFVDDVQLAHFARKGGDQEEGLWGNGVAFNTNNGGSSPTIFSRIWVAPWNGQTPTTKPKEAGKESVALANGDESFAKIKSASTKSFTIDFEGEPLEIPRNKILLADFGMAPEKETPQLSLQETVVQPRLRLAKGGTLTVENLKIETETVHCGNKSFGELNVPLGAVSEIIWNGLDKDLQALQGRPKTAPKRNQGPR